MELEHGMGGASEVCGLILFRTHLVTFAIQL